MKFPSYMMPIWLNNDNKQDVAGKLLLKLIKEGIKDLSPIINNLKLK